MVATAGGDVLVGRAAACIFSTVRATLTGQCFHTREGNCPGVSPTTSCMTKSTRSAQASKLYLETFGIPAAPTFGFGGFHLARDPRSHFCLGNGGRTRSLSTCEGRSLPCRGTRVAAVVESDIRRARLPSSWMVPEEDAARFRAFLAGNTRACISTRRGTITHRTQTPHLTFGRLL